MSVDTGSSGIADGNMPSQSGSISSTASSPSLSSPSKQISASIYQGSEEMASAFLPSQFASAPSIASSLSLSRPSAQISTPVTHGIGQTIVAQRRPTTSATAALVTRAHSKNGTYCARAGGDFGMDRCWYLCILYKKICTITTLRIRLFDHEDDG